MVEDDLEGTLVVVASEANGAPEVAWVDVFFIYKPDDLTPLERHFPYATIVHNDYPGFDESSDLDPVTIDYGVLDHMITDIREDKSALSAL